MNIKFKVANPPHGFIDIYMDIKSELDEQIKQAQIKSDRSVYMLEKETVSLFIALEAKGIVIDATAMGLEPPNSNVTPDLLVLQDVKNPNEKARYVFNSIYARNKLSGSSSNFEGILKMAEDRGIDLSITCKTIVAFRDKAREVKDPSTSALENIAETDTIRAQQAQQASRVKEQQLRRGSIIGALNSIANAARKSISFYGSSSGSETTSEASSIDSEGKNGKNKKQTKI